MTDNELLIKIWDKVKEIDGIKEEMSQIKGEVSGIQVEVSNIKGEVTNILEENKQMKHSLARMEDVLNSDLKRIQRDIGKLTSDISLVYKIAARNMSEIENLKDRDVC